MNKKIILFLATGLVLCIAGMFFFIRQDDSKLATPVPLADSPPLDVGITLPLQMRLSPLAEVGPAKVVPMRVECALQMPQAEVAIKIEWPRTAQLVSGKAEWRGLMRQSEPLQLDFALRLAGPEAGYVIAQAEVIPPGGKIFSQGTSVYLDPQRSMESAQATKVVQGYAGANQIRVHRPNTAQKQ